MAYGHLFDLAREQRFQAEASERRVNLLSAIGFKLIEHKALLNAATVLMRLYQKTGLQFLLRKTGLLRVFKLDKAESLMPEVDISNLANAIPPTNNTVVMWPCLPAASVIILTGKPCLPRSSC